jgi:isopentenyl-diphosphate delta-isomerase
MEEKLILVDETDQEIGTEEKLKTHQEGRLHRAFSIFIFNSKRELLLQKRSSSKYHSPGVWTNTCCSHPRPGETIEEASHRRLKEEMGFDTELKEIFSFIYRHEFENGLIENEFDHALIGFYDDEVSFNKGEVEEVMWVKQDKLKEMVENNPKAFSAWFLLSYERVLNYINENSV